MVKYLGSKRTLVPLIRDIAAGLPVASAADPFTGTTRVAQGLRQAGLVVHAGDTASYSEVLGGAYVVAGEDTDRAELRRVLAHLQALPGVDGYVTQTFCRTARFLQEHNGRRVDAIRAEIDRLGLEGTLRALVLTSLLEATDRVDSTCGLQMAFVKTWSKRSFRPLTLREPAAVDGPPGTVARVEANAHAAAGGLDDVDLVYLDPPYNRHSYFSNYHVWETLVRWDAPPHYGVACKREDCRTTKSAYNSVPRAWGAYSDLVSRVRAPWIVASFSDEGFHRPEAIEGLLASTGREVRVLAVDAPRYVGARIGIHNPAGERVGTVSHLRNRELLFVAGPDGGVLDAALAGAERRRGAAAPLRTP
jgi:adenine-specific DNA-methyltransferase